VRGKPLHTWALEGRLSEIEIPTKESLIHKLTYLGSKTLTASELHRIVKEKIETIPPVTDERKALGADFRRADVRAGWKSLYESNPHTHFHLLRFRCVASSGTYMRSLAEVIGEKLGTEALAYSIHRTKIGKYLPLIGSFGFWTKTF
jgi:tRNA U55 pseudouridine synthase TruB